MHRLIANVLRGMGQRVAIDNVARLERTLRDLAICCVVAIPTPCQNIDDVGGVRVHLLFGAGWQDSFENADTIVSNLTRIVLELTTAGSCAYAGVTQRPTGNATVIAKMIRDRIGTTMASCWVNFNLLAC